MTQTVFGSELVGTAKAFHGELCPGLAMGIQAARIAVDRLGNEGLVAVAETDICATDAVQALTGCTVGNRNLIQLDHGKNVYTFFRRSDGKAIRLSGRPAWGSEYQALRAKVNAGLATEAERASLADRTAEEAQRILDMAPDALYAVTEVDEPVPATSQVDPWLTCDSCGEPVMETRARRLAGRELCVPCFSKARSKAS